MCIILKLKVMEVIFRDAILHNLLAKIAKDFLVGIFHHVKIHKLNSASEFGLAVLSLIFQPEMSSFNA